MDAKTLPNQVMEYRGNGIRGVGRPMKRLKSIKALAESLEADDDDAKNP